MGLGQFFKDLFGSAKETASKTADKTEVVFDEAKVKASEYAAKAEVYVEEKVKDIKEAYPEMAEKVERYTEKAKDVVSEYAEKIGDKVENVVEDVRERVHEFTAPPIVKTSSVVPNAVVESEELSEDLEQKIEPEKSVSGENAD